MNNKLKGLLKTLSHEQLIDLINKVYSIDKSLQLAIEKEIASFDPKELYKIVNKMLTTIKRGKKFIDYYDAPAFSQQLSLINDGIEKILQNDAGLAVKLCQSFIEIDSSICNRVDDSNGFLLDCYLTTYKLLDKAFIESGINSTEVGQYLFDTYMKDRTGLRSHILEQCKHSLRSGADKVFQRLIDKSSLSIESYHALQTIADAHEDVDTYISLVEKFYQQRNQDVHDQEICKIAERLNKAFRADESIQWLKKIGDASYYTDTKTNLLIEAYKLEGQDGIAQSILWDKFERYLVVEDYMQYLKNCPQSESESIRTKAIDSAKKCPSLKKSLQFLKDINQWDDAEEMVIEHARKDLLDGSDYSLYRKLSTALSKQDKRLAATLLRRAVVLQMLSKGKSKYYDYAVSDLNKAKTFASCVEDWRGFDTHDIYFEKLFKAHHKKTSFFSRL